MTPTWGGDRRASTRRRAEVRFVYRFRGVAHEATLTDTSETGAFLLTVGELPSRDSTLLLEAHIPARPNLLLRFVVEVAWVRPPTTEGGPAGMGIRWRRAYCNQGAPVLRAFVKQQLQFELKAPPSPADRPGEAHAEVLYDFENRRIKLRNPAAGPLAGYYRRPTPHSAMLVEDLPSDAPVERASPHSDDVRRVWRAFGGVPPRPAERHATPAAARPSPAAARTNGADPRAGGLLSSRGVLGSVEESWAPPAPGAPAPPRPAAPRAPAAGGPPTESLRPAEVFQPRSKVGLTYSTGAVHYPGHALRVGGSSMRIATMEPPAAVGSSLFVRVPVPVGDDFEVVALRAIVTGGRVGGASGGANVFEVLFQDERPGDIPDAYRAFVVKLREEASRAG